MQHQEYEVAPEYRRREQRAEKIVLSFVKEAGGPSSSTLLFEQRMKPWSILD